MQNTTNVTFTGIYGEDLNKYLPVPGKKLKRKTQRSPPTFDLSTASPQTAKRRNSPTLLGFGFAKEDSKRSTPFHKTANQTATTEQPPSEFSQTQTQNFFPYSISKVRNSRVKIENDVLQMHNRINLLEAEEKRALRRIDETRKKADQMLKIRHESLQFKKTLD